MQKNLPLPAKIMHWGIAALLIAMPFHAFAVIALGNFIGGQQIWQAWKEVLSLGLIGLSVYVFLQSRRRNYVFDTANISACILIVFGVLLTLSARVPLVQALFGVKVVVLPLVLFGTVQLARVRFDKEFLTKAILWPAYIVAVIAILQEFIIPLSWWSFIGYGEATIRPLQLVDPAVQSIRAFATLGGPNQLGAYMILPTLLGLVLAIKKRRIYYALGALLTFAAVVVSFSRSAWLGLSVAGVAAIVIYGNRMVRMLVAVAVSIAAIAILALGSSLPARLQNTQIQYFLLHGRYSQTQEIEGSDFGRLQSLNRATSAIADHPWGNGLGTAGPASFRSDKPFITENWYLQIAIEIGVIGVVLFLIFFGANIIGLIRSQNVLWQALAAVVCGLLVTNLFLHAWADSTLGIMIFSLLGLAKVDKS